MEEWDAERGVLRETRYAELDIYEKLDFLSRFSYQLALTGSSSGEFDHSQCKSIYAKISERFGLPKMEHDKVALEIESTTGIIAKTSYDKFEFCHKSIFEFLVAEHISRAGIRSVDRSIVKRRPDETAIAVALSSEPEHFLVDVLFGDYFSEDFSLNWLLSFFNRLVLEKPTFGDMDVMGKIGFWVASQGIKHRRLEEFQPFLDLPFVGRGMSYVAREGYLEMDSDKIVAHFSFKGVGTTSVEFQTADFENSVRRLIAV